MWVVWNKQLLIKGSPSQPHYLLFLCLGTSTGSILAAYIATKGGTAYENIIGNSKQYGGGISKAKTFISNLEAGQWYPTIEEKQNPTNEENQGFTRVFDPLLTTELVKGK